MNRLALLVLVLALSSRDGAAQEPQRECSYDACSLRVIDAGGYFGQQVVVRGRAGLTVAVARRSDALESVFAVNDSSAAYYAAFETHERYADWAGWVGTGLMFSGFVADLLGKGGLFSRSFLLYGGGLAVTYGVAGPLQGRASTDLSNAIWWYNRSLSPSP